MQRHGCVRGVDGAVDIVLALCKHRSMATLYIRDVPDNVAAILRDRAAAVGMSLSAYAAEQLSQVAATPSNAEIIERLRRRDRSEGPTTDEILVALNETRR